MQCGLDIDARICGTRGRIGLGVILLELERGKVWLRHVERMVRGGMIENILDRF